MQHYIFIIEAMSKSLISKKRARTHANKKQKKKINVLGWHWEGERSQVYICTRLTIYLHPSNKEMT